MNLVKSVFVSIYMAAAMAATVFAVRSAWETGQYLAWGGVLLVYGPFLAFLGYLMLARRTARTSRHLPLLAVLGVAGVAAAASRYLQGGDPLALWLAGVGLVAFFVYAWWYSSFNGRGSEQLGVGRRLPDLVFLDEHGGNSRAAMLTDKPVIWIFYRGNWCPLCMAQIKELVAEYRQLEAMGVRVALVSPQPHKNTIRLAKKFDVSFNFLTDEGNRAARTLGIAQEYGVPMGMQVLGYDSETVLPTVIITEPGGRILWAHETDNYRVRPEPGVYLDLLRG
jgi:peroxiredoxin